MKNRFRIAYFSALLILIVYVQIYSQAQDPFNWTKPVKVESNDVFLQWLQNDGNTVHSYQKIYRYKIDSTFLPTDNLVSKTFRHEDSRQNNYLSYTDAASGKFNVSPYDEVVSIWQSTDGIKIMIPKFDTSSGLWLNTVKDSININVTSNRIYVRTGDLDDDSLDEFIVSYVTKDDSIHFNIYDVDSTLHPSLITSYSDVQISGNYNYTDTNPIINSYYIETGDLNGDGKDEITLQWVDQNLNVHLRIYELNQGKMELMSGKTIQTRQYVNDEIGGISIAVASGHFNSDAKEELAFLTVWQHIQYPFLGSYKNDCFLNIIDVSSDLKQINFQNSQIQSLYLGDYGTSSNPGNFLSLAAGDLNNDGRDEIVFATNYHIYTYSTDNSLNLYRKVTGNIASVIFNNFGRYYYNFLKVSDVNQDNRKEIIVAKKLSTGFFVSMISANDNLDQLQLIGRIIGDEPSNNITPFAICAGNFDGDNFTIGQPKHYVQNNVVQPVVILNAPPIHFDKFNDSVFDINSCYNGGDCNFTATYVRTVQHASEVTTTVHKDWELSHGQGASGSLGAAATVNYEAHFLQKYGRHFSKDSSNSHQVSVSVSVQAQEDDQIYATVTNFDVWQYPLYHGNETFPRRYVLTVVPNHVEATWYPSKSYNAVHYIPDHEVGNILSYQNYDDPSNNPDLSQTIKANFLTYYYTLGANTSPGWKLDIYDFRSSKADTVEENGIDADVNFGVIASVNYSNTVMSTQTTSIGSNTELTVQLGSVNMGIGDVRYTVKPYAYWSNSGTLVLNYAVEPELAPPGFPNTWWQDYYGNNSDPAFILPWRLDPEKGFKLSENAKRFQTKDITFSPSNPNPGDTVTITACVRNFSLIPTPSAVSVKFYIGDPDSGGTPILGINGTNSVSTIGPIPERGNDDVKMKWVLPSGIPSYPRIYAVLDKENSIHEIHLDNNKGFNVLGAPSITTGITEETHIVPAEYKLYQSYPNPFNPSATIRYTIPHAAKVNIKIYDILGREIAVLVDEYKPAGTYSVKFNGDNLASGVYFYQLHAGNFIKTNKMILMK